jgi:hypothetical protein
MDFGPKQKKKSEPLGSAAPIIYLSRFDPFHFSTGKRHPYSGGLWGEPKYTGDWEK